MKKEKIEINGGMTIGQVLEARKNAAEVLMGFGMFCFGCPHAQAETLAEASVAHEIDLDLLIEKLNKSN